MILVEDACYRGVRKFGVLEEIWWATAVGGVLVIGSDDVLGVCLPSISVLSWAPKFCGSFWVVPEFQKSVLRLRARNHLDRQSVVGFFPLGSYSATFSSKPIVLGSFWVVPEFQKSVFETQGWEPSRSTERGRFLPSGSRFSTVWPQTH